MIAELLDYVLDAFKDHVNAPSLYGEITGLPGEDFITLSIPQPTIEQHELVRALEGEFDELGCRAPIKWSSHHPLFWQLGGRP